jgi:beta-glucosidase
MRGRTYRYYDGSPLYPFGHGLSYTTFVYSDLTCTPAAEGGVAVTVTVQNTGKRSGDEVVQVYVQRMVGEGRTPRLALRGFRRVTLDAGATRTVQFTLPPSAFTRVMEDGTRVLETTRYRISVGGGQPDTAAPVIQSDYVFSS